MTGDAGSAGGFQVGVLVADEKALFAIDWPNPQEIEDHAGRWLAPVRHLTIFGHSPLRMERAVTHVVDPRAARGKFVQHPRMERLNLLLREIAASDPCLVGDQKDVVAGLVEAADGGGGARYPTHALARPDISVVVDEHAIAVEENGGLLLPDPWSRGLLRGHG